MEIPLHTILPRFLLMVHFFRPVTDLLGAIRSHHCPRQFLIQVNELYTYQHQMVLVTAMATSALRSMMAHQTLMKRQSQ